MRSHSFYIEDDEYLVDISQWTPVTPARLGGAPEDCYPEEGGEVDVGTVHFIKNGSLPDAGEEAVDISFTSFLENYAIERGIAEISEAEESVMSELVQAMEAADESAHDDAMEARAEARRENMYDDGYNDW